MFVKHKQDTLFDFNNHTLACLIQKGKNAIDLQTYIITFFIPLAIVELK